jgi:hypothetical protein
LAGGFCSPQPASASAAAMREMAAVVLFMGSPRLGSI